MPIAAKTSPRRPGRGPAPRAGTRPKIEAPWRLQRVGGLEILELAAFRALGWLVHGFSTRTGGASVPAPGERVCNLGFTEWDLRESVMKNRQMFQSALGAGDHTLLPLSQFHSSVVHFFAAAPSHPLKGDAALTGVAGLLLAVQTADCVPILLVDPKRRAIAAVHAGWRGTLARITEKTVGEMRQRLRSNPADLLAAIGPSIGSCCYEVGTELVAQFASQFADAGDWFDELRTGDEPNPLQWLNRMPPGHQPPPKKVRLDLPRANRAQLLAAGLAGKNIFRSGLCTACHPDLFFSYRKEGHQSGRLLSVVGIRP